MGCSQSKGDVQHDLDDSMHFKSDNTDGSGRKKPSDDIFASKSKTNTNSSGRKKPSVKSELRNSGTTERTDPIQ